jgi:pyruvate/2-oxoglutarate/acetoin dehydrogenase E1 component
MLSETGTVRLFFREAICRAVLEEMQLNPDVMVLGQDVGSFGGAYKEFAGSETRRYLRLA